MPPPSSAVCAVVHGSSMAPAGARCHHSKQQHHSSSTTAAQQQTQGERQNSHQTDANTDTDILCVLRTAQLIHRKNVTLLWIVVVVDVSYVLTLQKLQHIFRIAEVSMHCCKPEVFTLDIFANIDIYLDWSLSGL